MLDRVSRILGRIGDRRAAGDVDLAGGPGIRCRIRFQRSLAKSRAVRIPCCGIYSPTILIWRLLPKKSEGRPCEDPIPCGPDPRPASRSGVQLGGAHRDFLWKMLFQRPLIQWLAGLRVHHQLANHCLRDAQTHQDLDVVALLWGRNEGFSPAATRLPRHCTVGAR